MTFSIRPRPLVFLQPLRQIVKVLAELLERET